VASACSGGDVVNPSTVARVVILPPSAVVQTNAQLKFSAVGLTDAGDTVPVNVAYFTDGGTVDATGEFTAGSAPGDYMVIATLVNSGLADTADVSVQATVVLTDVIVVPPSVSLAPGNTQSFVALGVLSTGDTVATSVTWTATGGTISSSGLYTAGSSPGTYQAIGTHQSGPADSAEIAIAVAPSDGQPDPMALPDAVGQAAQTAAYNALSVSTQPAGFSYTDPTTGVKVWKVTSATVPFSNSGMSNDYTDAGQRISQPWQSGGQTYWTIIAYAAFNGSEYWLVDFNKTTGFSNWRHLTGQLRPDVDLCFSFSNNPATPRIAYVINGGSIRRINTETMTVANTGNFPHSGAVTWLQVDRNDAWFVVQSSNGHMAWNSQTNVEYRNTLSYDEARLERDGNYAFLTNVNGGRRWNLADNTVTNSQNWGTTYWAAHMADLRGYWSTVDGYNTTPLGLDVYYANPAGDPNNGIGIYQDVYTGTMAGLTHHSGNWIQDVNDRTQWAFMQDDGGSPPAGKLRNGIAAYRLDGTAFKLVAHHYSTATDYYKEPWATPSPDGRLVLFASNMNGAGSRTDLFLIEMPLR
jgi:hypothetical protein